MVPLLISLKPSGSSEWHCVCESVTAELSRPGGRRPAFENELSTGNQTDLTIVADQGYNRHPPIQDVIVDSKWHSCARSRRGVGDAQGASAAESRCPNRSRVEVRTPDLFSDRLLWPAPGRGATEADLCPSTTASGPPVPRTKSVDTAKRAPCPVVFLFFIGARDRSGLYVDSTRLRVMLPGAARTGLGVGMPMQPSCPDEIGA